MPLIDGLDKAKLPDIRPAKGCLEWLYVGANRAMHALANALTELGIVCSLSSARIVANPDIAPVLINFRVGGNRVP